MNISELLEKIKQLPSLNFKPIDIIQVVILSLCLYYLIRTLYKTRAWILVKGLIIIGVAYAIVYFTDMTVLSTIMQSLFSVLVIAIIIMMQPELQKIVETIGTRRLSGIRALFHLKPQQKEWSSKQTISSIVSACEVMSPLKTGALIIIEKAIPLKEYIQSGIALNSDISRQLLIQIFEKNTPLHDGAVIISNNKIASATSYLPLSDNTQIDKGFGTRHRAAIGISEVTDCISIIVSEETGAISICVDGKITHDITTTELERILKENVKDDGEIKIKKKSRTPLYLKLLAPIVGLCLWAGIMMESDPLIIKTFNDVPVQIINSSVLDDIGQSYSIVGNNKISIQLKGRRSVIDTLNNSQISAIADINKMSIVNSVPIDVNLVSSIDVSSIEIKTSEDVLMLALEDLVQIDLPISTEIINDIDNNYVVMVKNIEIETLTVTCTQSMAKTLDRAVLQIDAMDKTNDFVISVEPIIYDKNGEIVTERISATKQKVRVQMSVLEVQEYNVDVTIKDQLAGGKEFHILNGYELEPNIVRIASKKDDGKNSISICIDPSDLTTGAGSILFNLKSVLDDDMYLAKDQDEQIAISLDLTTYLRKFIPFTVDQITISSKSTEMFNVQLIQVPTSIVVYVNSSLPEIEKLSILDLNPTVKITENKEGEYSTTLILTDIEGVKIDSDLTVTYTLSKKGA